jgi:hypothetical protein
MKVKVVGMVAVLGLMFSCAAKKPIGTQTLISKKGDCGDWIYNIPKTKDGIAFFRGAKTGAVSEEGGLNDARMHAAQQVAEMVKTEANVDYERARVEYGIPKEDEDVGSVVRDAFIALSDAIVQGVKEVKSCVERYEEVTHEGVRYFFNVYTLVSISEEDYKRIAARVLEKEKEKARERNNKKAEEFLDKMRGEIQQRKMFQEESE